MKDLITVIIPVYNVGQYVEKCIQSIVDQTYRNLEIIPVDDGSTDNCPEILDKFASQDSRIKVVHKSNGGLIASRKSGFEVSTGKYLFFVDGDDWIEPLAIELLYNSAEKHKADIAFGLYHSVDENGKEVSLPTFAQESLILDRDQYIKRQFSFKTSSSVCVKLYLRSLFTLESFDFPREHAAAEDHLINCATYKNVKRVVGVPDVLYNYFMRSDSICHTFTKTVDYYLAHQLLARKAMGEHIALKYKSQHDAMFLTMCVNIIIGSLMRDHLSYARTMSCKNTLALARKDVVPHLSNNMKVKLFLFKHPPLLHLAARCVELIKRRRWLKIDQMESN